VFLGTVRGEYIFMWKIMNVTENTMHYLVFEKKMTKTIQRKVYDNE